MYTLTMLIVFSHYHGITSQKIESRHSSKEICEEVRKEHTASLTTWTKVEDRVVTSRVFLANCLPVR